MAFLGGTFFPLENFPVWAQNIIYFLPLTHAATAIRSAAFGNRPPWISLLILAVIGILFFSISVWCVKKAKD
jgi:ABC-type multidrug transport system permease subunit